MTSPDEVALLRAALAGDSGALRRLVDVLTPVIRYRVALVLSRLAPRRAFDAQDLIQEILLALFGDGARLLRTWDPGRGASLAHFVGLVAQRRAISVIRNDPAVRQRSDDLHEVEDELPAGDGLPETQAASREELTLLLARLQASLSPLGLELFYRLYVHDESPEQVCASTGLSRNAVYIWRTRLAKLCQVLRIEIGARTPPVLGLQVGGVSKEMNHDTTT